MSTGNEGEQDSQLPLCRQGQQAPEVQGTGSSARLWYVQAAVNMGT